MSLSEGQLKASQQVLKRTLSWAAELAPVTSQFPISTADGKPGVDLRRAAYHVMGFEVDLLEMREFLRETDLDKPIITAISLTLNSRQRLRALARSMTLEDLASNKEKRAWTWSAVETMFNARVRPEMTEMGRCDWDELVEGTYMHDLDDQMWRLIQLALRLLLSDHSSSAPSPITPMRRDLSLIGIELSEEAERRLREDR